MLSQTGGSVQPRDEGARGDERRASVVISTYNRADALRATLDALAKQDVPADDYEVLVVDDGSTDATPAVLESMATPYSLRVFRQPVNSGVSAGRNTGMRAATGAYVIMISDDLIVPPEFVRVHLETHQRYPNSWVVGGFEQLPGLTESPFGRYLDALERSFEDARTGRHLAGPVYEMTMPTARNLSMPRSDLERIGFFDEQFRVTCEDQDLAERARPHGVRYIYNTDLQCIHNDQAATLNRYCRFQQRGARDTVRFCRKYPQVHGNAPVLRANSYIARADGPKLVAVKVAKALLARPPIMRGLESAIRRAERVGVADRALARLYRLAIGLYTFRGVREGLRQVDRSGDPGSARDWA